jgi:hypothetical protein
MSSPRRPEANRGRCIARFWLPVSLFLLWLVWTAAAVRANTWVDLGVAEFPPGASTSRESTIQYRWSAPALRPAEHRLGVRIHSDERRRIDAEVARIKRATRFEERPNGFRWDPSSECGSKALGNREVGWRCIYAMMSRVSEPGVAVVNARFAAQLATRQLDTAQAVSLIVSFIQEIPYDRVTDRLFGVLPPALVLHERRGDCDSKSLLGHLMLAAIGIESHILLSDAHEHAILAIRIPGPGVERRIGGQRFLLTEMTSRHPIGRIDPKLMSPDDWFPVQVLAPGRSSVSPGPPPSPTSASRDNPQPPPALPNWSAEEVRAFVEGLLALIGSVLRFVLDLIARLLA